MEISTAPGIFLYTNCQIIIMNKFALVTGAAKGIGRSIAFELAKRGFDLLLADIDGTGLYRTAATLRLGHQVFVDCLEIDLATEGAGEKIRSWSKHYHDKITVIVNNAGYGLNAAFTDIPFHEHVDNINVNIRAVLEINHLFVPILRQRSGAYILNVVSTTAYQPVPYLNVYASTKAFMLSFTRSLRYELRNSTVSVTALSPGSTDTDFVNRAGMGDTVREAADRFNMTPDRVAKIAIDGLFKGRAEVIPGFVNKLNAWLPKFFPKSLVEKIAGSIYEPRTAKLLQKVWSATG